MCNICTLVLSGYRRSAARTRYQKRKDWKIIPVWYSRCEANERALYYLYGRLSQMRNSKPEAESSLVLEIYCAKRSSIGMVALDYLVWMSRE